VDDKGNVVYSQTPPTDGRETKMVAPPPPPAEDPEAAMQRIRSQSEKLEQASEARNKLREDRIKQKREAEERKKNCEIARKNLETLKSRPPNTLYQTGENRYQRFTMEELDQKMKEQEQIIEENCK